MVNIKVIQPMNRVDFHSHILPGIDDGSKDEAQSYAMLLEGKKHGVKQIVVTPHFYPDEPSVKEFVERRQKSRDKLELYIRNKEQQDLPHIIHGAEVLLGVDTADLEDLRLVGIQGTDYILIELPYAPWKEWVYESVEKIKVTRGLIPVIAHVERYVPFQKDLESIHRMMNIKGVLGQVNTRSILDRKTRGLSLQLIGNSMVHVIGSDAHRVRHLEGLDDAYNYIVKKYGIEKLEGLHEQGRMILRNERIIKQECRPLRRILGRF